MKFLITRRCRRKFVGLIDGKRHVCNLPAVHSEGSLAPACMVLNLSRADRRLFRGIVREHEDPTFAYYASVVTR